MSKKNFLAFDLGAESGRAIVGNLKNNKINLDVLHRFTDESFSILGTLHWDIGYIFNQMKNSLRIYKTKYGSELNSIGIDTWGVDFGLIGKDGSLLSNPVHYRDKRTDGIMEKAFKIVPKDEIFKITGIQFMQINTLYQLLSLVLSKSPLLSESYKILMIPDLLHYFFTGNKCGEFTVATTSQMFDPKRNFWSKTLCEKLNIPFDILPDIVKPCTKVGHLLNDIRNEFGLGKVSVVAVATHDTGSAVVSVPVSGDDQWAFLSSGTWSLLGVENKKVINNTAALKANYTNEGGVNGTYRFLKNIMGLWLLQECRRKWNREGTKEMSYSDLVAMAKRSKPMKSFISPNDSSFLKPADMELAIKNYCKKTHQDVPTDKGEITRCIFESLAFAYRNSMDNLNGLLDKKIKKIHIIGGGAQNALLCQFTANATHVPVMAGPIEATAIGNILMQMIASGEISSVEDGRNIIRKSFEIKTYGPQDEDMWEDAYKRYLKIC